MSYNFKPLTKYGKFMYNLCFKTGVFLSKHKVLLYILMFTWGLPMSILGLIVSLFMLITGHKPIPYHGVWYFETKWIKWWGGVELGCCFCKDQEKGERIQMHEFGHLHQVILGPFFIFLVAIPSAVRYWMITLFRKKYNPPYDQIWFERCATDLGHFIITGKKKYID